MKSQTGRTLERQTEIPGGVAGVLVGQNDGWQNCPAEHRHPHRGGRRHTEGHALAEQFATGLDDLEESVEADQAHEDNTGVHAGVENHGGEAAVKHSQSHRHPGQLVGSYDRNHQGHEQVGRHQVLQIDCEGVGAAQVQ